MSEKIIPTGDNVVLELLEQKKTAGGLYIPEKAKTTQRDAIIGRVVAVGPGRISEYGARMEAGVRPSEYVLIPRAAGTEIEMSIDDGGKRLRIIRGVEILAIVEESRIVTLGLVTP